ncbi:hypothetical protein [Ketogulonicigenium robustum]|nr:hypothetical protein [Ketogulonicigenium robustum]
MDKNLKAYIAMTVIGLLPLLSVVVAGHIATLADCPLHEGAAQACIIYGYDAGPLLHSMTVLGWLMLVTNLCLIAGVAGLLWCNLRALAVHA